MKKLYWNRFPGRFVHKFTGAVVVNGPSFTGTQCEWDETLIETIIDLATLVNTTKCVLKTSDFIADILEKTVLYRNGKIVVRYNEAFAKEYKLNQKYEFCIEREEGVLNIIKVVNEKGVVVGEVEVGLNNLVIVMHEGHMNKKLDKNNCIINKLKERTDWFVYNSSRFFLVDRKQFEEEMAKLEPLSEEQQNLLRFATPKRKIFLIDVLKCECGGEKANTTHSDWCPKGKNNAR